ncbi:DUF2079 domain-containing protein [Tardisphaera miroshnichenkoae]
MRPSKPSLIVLIGVVAYSAYWSWFSLTRYYDLYAGWLDLGVELGFMESVVRGSSLISLFLDSPLHFIISPLIIFRSPQLFLVLQACAIGAAALPLYGIARAQLGDELSAAFISLSYLIYFPLAPGNGFDFHMQVFFPTFFLSGYYLYIRGKKGASFAFFTLSAFIRKLYEVFPALFAVIVLADALAHREKRKRDELAFPLALLALSLSLLGAQYLLAFRSPSSVVSFLPGKGLPSGPSALGQNLVYKAYTVVALFLPLLFLPLLSRRWLLFTLPYFFALFALNYWAYGFPSFLQYAYGVVPFLYLGAIEGARRVGRKISGRKVAAALLVVVSLFALFYEPYGPFFSPSSFHPPYLSPYYENDYDGELLSSPPDFSLYGNLTKVLSYVPPSASLLTDNDVPEAYYVRDVEAPYGQLSGPYLGDFDYVLLDLHVQNQVPSVRLLQWYSPRLNVTMVDVANAYLKKGYGMLAEGDGVVLMKANYSGPLLYYSPLEVSYPSSFFFRNGSSSCVCGPYDVLPTLVVTGMSYSIGHVLYGPYSVLFPGKFLVTFALSAPRGENVTVYVSADGGAVMLASEEAMASGGTQDVTLALSLNEFYGWVGFGARGASAIEGVGVVQVAP